MTFAEGVFSIEPHVEIGLFLRKVLFSNSLVIRPASQIKFASDKSNQIATTKVEEECHCLSKARIGATV